MKFDDIALKTTGINSTYYKYNYNNNEYTLNLFEANGNEKVKTISFTYIKNSKIIIYLFDLSEDNDLNEEFINEIKEQPDFGEQIIYLVGNKLDIAIENYDKFRIKAKKLIDKGKINKYFELSAKSNEGIEFFLKHLKIDSTIIIDKNVSDPLNENYKRNIEIKYNLFKYLNL